jgi:hypothetical protein
MAPLVFAAVLWHASAPLIVPNGEARSVALPAVEPPARLAFRVRADYGRVAGSNLFLRLLVNGHEVGRMRDRRTSRLLSPPSAFGPSLHAFEFGRWRVAYGPITRARDEIVLDVSDLLRSAGDDVVTFEHGAATSAGPTPLVIDDLRLERGPAVPGALEPAAPDWTRPRLGVPRPPPFEAESDSEHVRVAWKGQAIDVRTAVTGGRHERRRTIVATATHIEVRDTVANPTMEPLGLRVRHFVKTDAPWVELGGRSEPDVVDAYDPWNPTVFTPVGSGGVGLVAEDDVFRQQIHVDFDVATATIGLRTDMLCLGPGERHTLVWSIYPTRTDSYWDFVNVVRTEWHLDRTIPGGYLWFTPDQVLALSDDELRAALDRRRIGIASMWGGWVDPTRAEHPPRIGFGTAVLGEEFADLRARIRTAVAKLRAARPDLVVLLYFDAQRDSSTDALGRYADSALAPLERTDWGGRYSPSWGMIPTTANAFGRGLETTAAAMRDLGADGLYWDEMDAVDYSGPRVSRRPWDGHTCVLDDAGTIRERIGLVNLLSDDLKVGLARQQFVLGNSPPTTRRLQGRLAMIEGQHNRVWSTFAHLSTPLAYIGARRDWAAVVEQIEQGMLVAGTRLDYDWDEPRMFPFTPEYIQPGTLRGRERIVTTRSGTHGWTTGGSVRAFRYDREGREHSARWHVKRRGEAVLVRVRLDPGEAGVIERVDHAAP